MNLVDNTASTQKVLVTKGNLATFTKDSYIRSITGGKSKLAVVKGRFVVVDATTGKALDQTNVGTTAKINIGVGVGKEIRWAFDNKGVSPKNLTGLAVGDPKCGTNPIYDTFFKCVSCDKTYVAGIQILDQDSVSQLDDIDNGEAFTVAYKPNCGGCEPNCNETTTCSAVAAGIVEKFNLAALNTRERKFYATQIFANDSFWCFPADEDGVLTTDVAEFTFGEVTVDSLTITTVDDLETLVYEINKAFVDNDVDGSATLIGVDQYGSSCQPYILVNTSATDFSITDYVASSTATPLTNHSGYCGIRFIVTMPTFDCDCKIKTVAYNLGRKAKIYSVEGFEDFTVTEKQSMALPEGFGAQVMWMEYEQDKGGEARKYSYGNEYVDTGVLMVNEPISRLVNSVSNSECATDYYIFTANFDIDHTMDKGFGNVKNGTSPNFFVAVPKDDTTTIVSVQAVLNAIATASGVATITYTGDPEDRVKGEN